MDKNDIKKPFETEIKHCNGININASAILSSLFLSAVTVSVPHAMAMINSKNYLSLLKRFCFGLQ